MSIVHLVYGVQKNPHVSCIHNHTTENRTMMVTTGDLNCNKDKSTTSLHNRAFEFGSQAPENPMWPLWNFKWKCNGLIPRTPKWKCHRFDSIFITGCTGSNENFIKMTFPFKSNKKICNAFSYRDPSKFTWHLWKFTWSRPWVSTKLSTEKYQ